MLRVVRFFEQICGVRARFSGASFGRNASNASHFCDLTNRPGASATPQRLQSYYFSRGALCFLTKEMGLSGRLLADPKWGFLTWKNDDGKTLSVSLAHTEDAVCAIFSESHVGIDIESQSRTVDKLAARLYTDFETSWSQSLSVPRIQVWCAKEAVLKALGTGVGGGLKRVELHPQDVMQGLYKVHSQVASVIPSLRDGVSESELYVRVETWNSFVLAVSAPGPLLEKGVHWFG